MIHGRLNKNEKLVLYGLVKYPLFNDRELSEKIKLKMTTVTAIKNRLKKNGYYHTVRIPVLQNLGCEILMATLLNLEPVKTDEIMNKSKEQTIGENVPEIIYSIIDSEVGFCIGISKNFSELFNGIINLEKVFRDNGINYSSMPSYYFFPFKFSKIYNFFDYAPILKYTFNVSVKGEEKDDEIAELPIRDLTKLSNVEKRVLMGLIKYPDLPDSKIADIIDVTRQVVSKLKKNFETEGIIKTLKIPNLKKLGFEILTVSHYRHNPMVSLKEREKDMKVLLAEFPQIFLISNTMESIVVNISRDFTEFQELKSKAHTLLKTKGYLSGDPKIFIFSIPKFQTIVEHNYLILIEKTLEILK